ncbi:hypothetical protein V6N13_079788 [Hibiscus sabdariffa]
MFCREETAWFGLVYATDGRTSEGDARRSGVETGESLVVPNLPWDAMRVFQPSYMDLPFSALRLCSLTNAD